MATGVQAHSICPDQTVSEAARKAYVAEAMAVGSIKPAAVNPAVKSKLTALERTRALAKSSGRGTR